MDEEKGKACRILVGKQGGQRPLGRYKCREWDNIKTYLRKIGSDGKGWIYLAQDTDQ
jgi:hypothetical protein